MFQSKLTFNSFEELEHHLRHCIHWNSTEVEEPYDTVGMTTLLSALLDNLQANTHSAQSDDLKEIVTEENIAFLKQLIL